MSPLGGGVGEGKGKLDLTLHFHHQNEFAFRWAAVWVTLMFHWLWEDKVSARIPQLERGQPKRIKPRSFCLPAYRFTFWPNHRDKDWNRFPTQLVSPILCEGREELRRKKSSARFLRVISLLKYGCVAVNKWTVWGLCSFYIIFDAIWKLSLCYIHGF